MAFISYVTARPNNRKKSPTKGNFLDQTTEQPQSFSYTIGLILDLSSVLTVLLVLVLVLDTVEQPFHSSINNDLTANEKRQNSGSKVSERYRKKHRGPARRYRKRYSEILRTRLFHDIGLQFGDKLCIVTVSLALAGLTQER